MKVKVYQIVRHTFDNDGCLLPKHKRTVRAVCIGTAIVSDKRREDSFVKDVIWDMFNWTCWKWRETNRHKIWLRGVRKGVRRDGIRIFPNTNATGFCGGDVFFKLWDEKWCVAMSVGWCYAPNYDEAKAMCISNRRF